MKTITEQSKRSEGSLSVEAAMVMPIFVFAIVILLYCIQAITLYEQIQSGVTEVAKSASKYAFVYQRLVEEQLQDEDKKEQNDDKKEQNEITEQEKQENEQEKNAAVKLVESLLDGVFYKIRFESLMKSYNINETLIYGGIQGVLFVDSSFMDEDMIEVVASYQLNFPSLFFRFHPIFIRQSVKTRGFVGRTIVDEDGVGEDDNDGTYVYITKTGTVYHMSPTCTYLHRNPVGASLSEIENKRNSSGAKYYPCATCIKKNTPAVSIYYTTYNGTRYHADKSCPQLERQVMKILLSEVGTRSPCKKCGK